MNHPTFDFLLDAHRYLRVHGLLGEFKWARRDWRTWAIVHV